MSLISHVYHGELGEWCADRLPGSDEVVRRLAAETKGLPPVRPAAPVDRRHWNRVDRAFAVRLAMFVQHAPPYSALYGLVRVGLVRPEWAHRQAALYPSHARLGEDERRRALDMRPTLTGWLDLADEHGVGKYAGTDGTASYARFPYSSGEPMLSELFDRMRGYLRAHAPLGRIGAEQGLARVCSLVASLGYVFRNDPADEPFYRLFTGRTPTVEELHAFADENAVLEQVELMRRLDDSGALAKIRRLAGNPPVGQPWGIASPVFGSYWADNDILVGGQRGTTLIDVSSVIAVNKPSRARRWIWRLLASAWFDTTDAYRIRNVALYFTRYGVLVSWPLDELIQDLLQGDDPRKARREFLALANRLVERTADEPAEASSEALSRVASRSDRHNVIRAPDAEPPERGDHVRAPELTRHNQKAVRERIEDPRQDTIEQALEKFLAEQKKHLSTRTFTDYEEVVSLLRASLNNYGYQDLDGDERRRFDDAYDQHRDGGAFCRTFGPEKIPENIGEFLGYFMARKVITTRRVLRATGPAVRRLGQWLAARDYAITAPDLEHMLEAADEAATDLPAAEELRRAWNDLRDTEPEIDEAEVEDTVEDVLFVRAVEPGLIHFADHSEDRVIEIPVPREISDLVKTGWEIYVEAALVDGEWRVSLIGTVYT
ncbi:hypothetical protein [Actinomadura decatromicini]|uniref:Uncharacterized protein n=1 Tax=Actinomadura decatromicini TaxID=2604572 RepID=A0A5D3FRU1_9ACTN|nr:hypothetical protein [Actinomadura decatromicini]TYK51061.1 hypothetical protein FXF68_11460 [Actinomadura decatromicini]